MAMMMMRKNENYRNELNINGRFIAHKDEIHIVQFIE